MDRQPPRATSDEIDLYIRTYYSLLRSTGWVRVRAFEEAHAYSNSSLHAGALDPLPDVAAFAYSAARLPDRFDQVRRLALGQSKEQFEADGLPVRGWERVTTRGRRRPLRYDGGGTLAAFVTSTTDIDDLVPIVTAYQIEWNKMHRRLAPSAYGRDLAAEQVAVDRRELGEVLELSDADVAMLERAFGADFERCVRELARRELDLEMRLVNGSFVEYQRAAHRWWSEIEPPYLAAGGRRRPVYFVSSNTHSLVNLLGGYALAHRDPIRRFVRDRNPEGLQADFESACDRGDEGEVANLLYYLLHRFLHDGGDVDARLAEVQAFDGQSGIRTIESPGHIDVSAQLIELCKLRPDRVDPRVRIDGIEAMADSDALIVNIDYPLGMAAYHHLSRLAQGAGELRGVYVMGKAATLNGRVGDVMISNVCYDEHSQNTYLFSNCFASSDVQPYVERATVLDNQKALTVRGSFLQNRDYMGVFYREGYTVLEMESGPYLSALYEMVHPNRHPKDEIVHLSTRVSFDVGVLHYGSDTPYSRRQSLLSKSLSYFGVDATYGCAIATVRRIIEAEAKRLAG